MLIAAAIMNSRLKKEREFGWTEKMKTMTRVAYNNATSAGRATHRG